MENEKIFEVNETKSVTVTERQLTDAIAEATFNAKNRIMEEAKNEGKDVAGLALMYLLIGAEINRELHNMWFKGPDA